MPLRIETTEAELRGVDEKLSDPKIYDPSRRDDFDRLTATRKELPARIAALYARWEELESVANG